MQVLVAAEKVDLPQLCLAWVTGLKLRQQALYPFMNLGGFQLNNLGCGRQIFNFDARMLFHDLEDKMGWTSELCSGPRIAAAGTCLTH